MIKIITDVISHSLRVSWNCYKLGKKLNISQLEMKNLLIAALFHDVGKLLINKKILFKKSQLTEKEKMEISKHSIFSSELIKTLFNTEIQYLVKNHHNITEIKKSKLLMILYIADIYDALTSKRVYKKAINKTEAIKEIINLITKYNINFQLNY